MRVGWWPVVLRPFWDQRVNALDCLCCLSILVHVIATLYYDNQDFSNSDAATMLDGVLVVVYSVNVAATLAIFSSNLLELYYKRTSIVRLTRTVSRQVLFLQQRLRAQRDTFMDAIKAISLASPAAVMVGSCVSHPVYGKGTVTSVGGSIYVEFDGGARNNYDADTVTAKLTIVSMPDGADSTVKLPTFRKAAEACLQNAQGSASAESAASIEALFFMLMLIDGDEGEQHSLVLSKRTREDIISDRGLSLLMVRPPPSAF